MAKFNYKLYNINIKNFYFAIFLKKKKIANIALLIKYLISKIISKQKVFILFALTSLN